MKYEDDDALDRALFALELEEPPVDLRASILTATVYRPQPAFALWEIALIALILGTMITLITLVIMGGGTLFVHTLQTIGNSVVRFLSHPSTLMWLAVGGSAAIWASLFTGFQPMAPSSRKVESTQHR